MEAKKKVAILKGFDLFDELSISQIRLIADYVTEKEFEPNTIFIEQEADANVAYFIYEGSAKVYRITPEGEEINLSIIGAQEVVGEMALLDHGSRSANVESIQRIKTLALSGEEFKKILKEKPEIAFNLLLILSKRVRKLSEFVEEIVSQKLPQRTWHVLVLLSKYFPNSEITLSQEELAQIIGATRARVTEILDNLESQGKIELSHKKVKIL